jgi:hypothetical protein
MDPAVLAGAGCWLDWRGLMYQGVNQPADSSGTCQHGLCRGRPLAGWQALRGFRAGTLPTPLENLCPLAREASCVRRAYAPIE